VSKVLVRKAVQAQYPVGAGAPILVVGGNQGRRGNARTLRESAGGLAGGALGALGAFAGQHRSLGSLLQSAISGSAQGGAIGRGLGRVFVGPESQARANIRQDLTDRYASARAAGEFDRHGIVAGKTPRTRVGAMLAGQGNDSMMARRLSELEQAKQSEKDAQAMERQRQEGRARVMGTEAAQREMDRMRADSQFGRNMRNVISGMHGLSDEEIYAAGQQGGTAARSGQGSVRVEPAGPTPNVNAAGLPVQVIGPNTPMNMLPAPSNLGDTAAGENKRMDDMGNQALVAQGTDNARAKTVEVTPPQQQEGDVQQQEGDVGSANVASFEAFERLKREKEKRERGSQQGDMSGQQETLF